MHPPTSNESGRSAVLRRAGELFAERLTDLQQGTDRLFAGLMIFEWLCALGFALVVSPRAWAGNTS
jgi:hypothetical protein